MMLKKFFLLSLLVLLSPLHCLAETDQLTSLLTELKEIAAQTQSLNSTFEQEKHLEIFAEKLISHGRFIYQQPDQLRWELLTPIASGFVLQGEKGQRWNLLSGERGRFSADKDPIMGMIARQLLAWARVDLDWLQQRYRMTLEAEQPVTLKLFPLGAGEAGFIDHLIIVFAADQRYVAEVLMLEQGGDSTRLRFADVQINQALPEDAFEAPAAQ